MVSINGLPPSLPGPNKANKTGKKDGVKKSHSKTPVDQPSKVASAVAHSIRRVDESDIHNAQLQYDLPEGHGRKALAEYMNVMNQTKREELSQLLGVDLYI
ncbi:chromosome partitioning protein ParA [Vibrio sp. Of14-4]|uniref:chromosome partitioning protein ParA n=1 Tax=Vibrio sp. Of14-4 TaxID=2724878 RepID=UPI001EF3476E|nr:chromosome partitioning protein ParA [Vibrio sp. Of14-4]MCG7489449.1 chromosome partitioning protein ParA [Vibrio sp. Of14-4]